jgi:hypothetical protein
LAGQPRRVYQTSTSCYNLLNEGHLDHSDTSMGLALFVERYPGRARWWYRPGGYIIQRWLNHSSRPLVILLRQAHVLCRVWCRWAWSPRGSTSHRLSRLLSLKIHLGVLARALLLSCLLGYLCTSPQPPEDLTGSPPPPPLTS